MKHICKHCDGKGKIEPSGLRCWYCDDGLADGYHKTQKIINDIKKYRIEQIIEQIKKHSL